MSCIDIEYAKLLTHILDNGIDKNDRTGVGTRSVFGYQMRADLANEFPLLTTKKVFFKAIVHELLWMLSGSTNVKPLQENGIHIWDEWADDNGDLGSVYGRQWRGWPVIGSTVDQVSSLINALKYNPDSRRLIISSWNVGELHLMALPPCHVLSQYYVANGKLSCQVYQRSADVFLGVPFNIASYALLTMMLAHVAELEVGELIHTFGDVHIYKNHFSQVLNQLTRVPREAPKVLLNLLVTNIFEFTAKDIKLENYNPHPAIKAPVAV